MKNKRILGIVLAFALVVPTCAFGEEAEDTDKFRVVVSTDFPPQDCRFPFAEDLPTDHKSDPDDLQSMVRFLLYANEFDVEGLVVSSGTFANMAKKENMYAMLDVYEQAYPQLAAVDEDYPTADELREVTYQGRDGTYGSNQTWDQVIGEGKDSEASDAIIEIVDKDDPRPVWFLVWGDNSNIAQAIWKVQNTRTEEELDKFISKIRIFQIAQQDQTIDWLMDNFPELFVIYSKITYLGIAQNNASWVQENVIENHGPLGEAYPNRGMASDGITEGDSPSFLYLVSAVKGLSDAEDPTGESWGGTYERVENTNHYVDTAQGPWTISKWNPDITKDFADRLELIEEKP